MVPLFAPVRQNEPFFEPFEALFREVLRSGHYILGEKVEAFEANLAQRLGFRHAIGCSSGTEALVLALKALPIEPGSEVITPSFSFIASASAVKWAGMEPVLADVEKDTFNLSVAQAERALSPKTRAVIAVDLYGRQAPIQALKEFCRANDLFLIEDGAQSIGVPNLGPDVFTTSFYPTKNVAAIGDAGAMLTDNDDVAERLHRLVQHGALARDNYQNLGTNARIDALQAGILNLKIEQIETWIRRRRDHAHYYLTSLAWLEGQGSCFAPNEDEGANVWSLFTLRIPNVRYGVAEHLKARGVSSGVYYPKALHQQPVCRRFKQMPCPNAEQLASEVLSIPIYPELTDEEREVVAKVLLECLPHDSI